MRPGHQGLGAVLEPKLFSTKRGQSQQQIMEPPSALLPTCVPWQGLLLTASLLTIWNIPAAAEPTIELVPPAVLEGKTLLLLAHNLPDDLLAYHWFKGKRSIDKDLIIMYQIKSQETKQGKLYSGRETLYPNGSLMLQNVTLKQSGIYHLNIHSADGQKSVFAEVFVYPLLSKPSIRSNRTTAVEGQDTVELICEPPFRKTTYLWHLNGKKLHVDDHVILSRGNATLTLLKVSRHFRGRYECEAKNPLSAFHSEPFTLDVFYGPDTPKIFPPYKYFEEGRSMWLSCQTVSHPKAHYSWNVNGEPWNSRQELSIHQVGISNNGLYTCLVTNPATGRNNSKVKEVIIVDQPSRSFLLSPPLVACVVAEILAGLAILGGLAYFAFFKKLDNRENHKRIQHRKKKRKNRNRAKEQRKARSNSILSKDKLTLSTQGHKLHGNSPHEVDNITYSVQNINT
ncbi:cell adhesion molecule CEACAM6-like isoform X3 [Arvicanthis niloticus]|uniref:cell adhesion molecule CEACAM6-like isoform X3 n=1 Tax=Arvicanthis niloticus TaxID=61156 RepID=UPI00402B3F3D